MARRVCINADVHLVEISEEESGHSDGPMVPNDGFATKNFGVHCYASKCLFDHGFRFTL